MVVDVWQITKFILMVTQQKEDWYQYDIEFRRSKLQLQISWGNMHHHLWLTHMLANRQDNVQSSTGSTNTYNKIYPHGNAHNNQTVHCVNSE
jgi:hypothetical protein